MTRIVLDFDFGKGVPPVDVLIEHLAYTVRNDFKETELVAVRNHPFEGPEVFDDEPLVEAECAVKAEVFRELSPWPTVDEVIKSLRGPDQ